MEQKLCACGCGQLIKPKSTWAHGHHSRVNNISKRPDIKQKRSQKMKEWHDSGTWVPWNKGISDERTLANGRVAAVTRDSNLEWHENVANSMRKNRQTFSGSASSQWKGGTSSLIQFLRADWSLYQFWKFPILKRDQFKCTKCGNTKSLEVHHDQERMCDILHKFVPEDKHELTYEEKKVIIHEVVRYHVDSKVSRP